MKRLLFTLLLLTNDLGFSHSLWVKMSSQESSCSESCSRIGLENVLSGSSTTSEVSAMSVCSGKVKGRYLVGNQPLNAGKLLCNIKGKFIQDSSPKNPVQCLCASDGLNRGSDYAWIKSSPNSKGRCDSSCRKTAPKYGYAVYAGTVKGSWVHVCSAPSGEVGYTGGGQIGCSTSTKPSDPFGCLCTRMYSGDLDKLLDPKG